MYWCHSGVIIQPGVKYLDTLFKYMRPGVYDVHVGQTIKISRLSHFISGGLVHLAFYVDNTVGEDRMVYGQLRSRDTIEWFWQSSGSGRDGTRQFVQEAVERILSRPNVVVVVKIINDRACLIPWMRESFKQQKHRQMVSLYIFIDFFHLFVTQKSFRVKVTEIWLKAFLYSGV